MTLDDLNPTPPDPVSPPSPGPDAMAAGDGAAATGGTEQGNTVSGAYAEGDMSLSNSAFYGDVYYMMGEQRRAAVRPFNVAHGKAVEPADEQRAAAHFAGMEGDAQALVRHLEERRVLLLTAPAGARKVTAATRLSALLGERRLCTRPALVFAPVDRNVRVNLQELTARQAQLEGRVVIFRYPLSRGNPYLTEVLGDTDRAGWDRLAETLRERNAFLVLTATPDEAQRCCGVASARWVKRELSPHTPQVLGLRLDEHLGRLEQGGAASAATLDALRGFRERLLREFPYAPLLTDFASFFADLDQPAMRLDDALAHFHGAGKRGKQELGEDFESWSFGFALALAQCTPDAAAVPWVDFDRLRRHLRRWLQRDLQITDVRREEVDDEPSEVQLELSDDSLLTRSRARVEKDPVTLADVISFCDGRPPPAVWKRLFQRNRRVLTAILPRLRELAERPDPEGRSLSVLAAQIIGRIGEMDWERVVAPMAERWATQGNGRHHGLVGAMFEGIWGSDEPRFRAMCLQYLKSMHAGSAEGRGKARLAAAIAAYSWVGYHDFALAMRELHGIMQAHLVPMIQDATRVAQQVTRVQNAIDRAAGRNDPQARALKEFLRGLVDEIYKGRGDIFLGVQFTLVSLCETQGVAPVLRELREWMGRGGASTGVLIALMFLHERGIANQLREDRAEFPLGEGAPPASCGQFVRALANGEDEVYQAVRFLGDLHECVNAQSATEALVRKHFREQLQAHLLEWIREALPVPELAAAVRSLVEQLSRTHHGKMRDLVMQLVSGSEFRRSPELKAFAASLRL